MGIVVGVLLRFDLTEGQMGLYIVSREREKMYRLQLLWKEILENPYIIFEQYQGMDLMILFVL